MMKTSGELQELITTLYIGFLGLIFSSYFVYLSEKGRSILTVKRGNVNLANISKARHQVLHEATNGSAKSGNIPFLFIFWRIGVYRPLDSNSDC
jgi:hypothetical protein